MQQLLEPQLVDLVDGDEQQLVVGWWVGLELLRRAWINVDLVWTWALVAAGGC